MIGCEDQDWQSSEDCQSLQNTRPGHFNDLNNVHRLDPEGWGLFRAALGSGQAVVGEHTGRIVGYAAATPLPGLAGHNEFRVFVPPAHRRQGWGSDLLVALINQCAPAGVRMISCSVESMEDPAALFLLRNDFFQEHTEVEMARDRVEGLPEVVWPEGYHTHTYPRREAIAYFRAVYELAFQGLPAYQPYVDDEEVDEALARAEDLRFAVYADRPVGFVWARKVTETLGEIEPIGVAQTHQGRGVGRGLLAEGLRYLAERGCRRVRLGVWADNEPAIRLYQQFGFRPVASRYFLARRIT